MMISSSTQARVGMKSATVSWGQLVISGMMRWSLCRSRKIDLRSLRLRGSSLFWASFLQCGFEAEIQAPIYIAENHERINDHGTICRTNGQVRRGAKGEGMNNCYDSEGVDVPMLSANHSGRMSSGSHISFGKFVVRSSTSTNSTSLAYKWGLRKDRLDISESLKCLGSSESCFKAWNCASLV